MPIPLEAQQLKGPNNTLKYIVVRVFSIIARHFLLGIPSSNSNCTQARTVSASIENRQRRLKLKQSWLQRRTLASFQSAHTIIVINTNVVSCVAEVALFDVQ